MIGSDCEFFGDPETCLSKYCLRKEAPCKSCDTYKECWHESHSRKSHVVAIHGFQITCSTVYELELVNAMADIEKYIKNKCKKIPGSIVKQGFVSSLEYVDSEELE